MSFRKLAVSEQQTVFCPICDEECDVIYKDDDGDVLGCESCITQYDAYEWDIERRLNEKACNDDRKYDEMRDSKL